MVLIKKIKIIVMALFTSNTKTQNEPPKEPQFDLDTLELEMLLKILSNADIKGNQVEAFYKMVIKLQNHYISKTNK